MQGTLNSMAKQELPSEKKSADVRIRNVKAKTQGLGNRDPSMRSKTNLQLTPVEP